MELKFTSKPHMPTLVISAIILFVAIFLPWGTAGVNFVSGVSDWGGMTTIAAILGILLSFLVTQQIRSLGLICVGLLALAGAIVYMTRLGGITVGYGIIIELIASLVAVFIGFMDYRQVIPPAKPPAPPPPQR